MMLRIGNSLVGQLACWPVSLLVSFNRQTGKPADRQTKRGFTLIEVMVTTAVLSLGIVLIYQAFFISLDSFNYCSNYLNVVSWADEKIWTAQDGLNRKGTLAQTETQGEFTSGSKKFAWILSYGSIDEAGALYKINLVLSWREGRRDITLARTAYALYEKEE